MSAGLRVWIHSKFVAGTCYGGYGPGQYSRHERNTRTLAPAGLRRPSSATAAAAGQAAQAVRGRSVGCDRRRDHIHLVGRILFRRDHLRTQPLPPPSPRDVQARRSVGPGWPGWAADGVRTVAARLPRRTWWTPAFPRRSRWSGWPNRWAGWSRWPRPVADDRRSESQQSVAAPLGTRA